MKTLGFFKFSSYSVNVRAWLINYIFLRFLGTSSHPISGACKTSCSNSSTADSESAAARASSYREANSGGSASAGITN